MITVTKLMNISPLTSLPCVCVVRTLKISSLSSFWLYNAIWLTLGSMLFIRSLEIICLHNWNFLPFNQHLSSKAPKLKFWKGDSDESEGHHPENVRRRQHREQIGMTNTLLSGSFADLTSIKSRKRVSFIFVSSVCNAERYLINICGAEQNRAAHSWTRDTWRSASDWLN